jgi:formiminoglutamase
MNLFSWTTRPKSSLFFSRRDENDPRLGDIVKANPSEYRFAQVVLLGCPQDEGVLRNGGRTGAAKAPNEIRNMFYRLAVSQNIASLNIFDLGNLKIQMTLEASHDLQTRIVEQVLRDGKKLIVLGGGNDISYADCKALAQVSPGIAAINIDSHFDVRIDQPRNSGTPYRQLLQEKIIFPEHFYEIAGKSFANSVYYLRYLQDLKVSLISLHALREIGIDTICSSIKENCQGKALFWGFDMDAVRNADAPGVSASYPVGLTAEEVCRLARNSGTIPGTKIIEITEVNPRYDIDNRTSRLAALIMWYYLDGLFL